jgi:hypothetical protein
MGRSAGTDSLYMNIGINTGEVTVTGRSKAIGTEMRCRAL